MIKKVVWRCRSGELNRQTVREGTKGWNKKGKA